jgi:hypothetical protein
MTLAPTLALAPTLTLTPTRPHLDPHLPDLYLSNGQPLLAALLLALRQAEPLCGVAAEVLCDAMQVGSYPDTQNAPILAGLLRDVLLGAPYCLGEQAAEGSTLAVARVLGAAVCAAPEVVESMDAAGGGEGERLRGLLLSLSSQPDRRCLEELAPAWAALTQLNAAPGHAASWRQLAEVPATPCATPRARGCNPMCSRLQPPALEAASPLTRSGEPIAPEAATPCPPQVLLRQSTLPDDGDAGGLVLDWAEVDEVDEEDFGRFRRHTVHECWQCAANALGAREVLRLVCASLALTGHGMTASGGGWRPLEATLLALVCIAPAVLPPPVRGQGLPPGGAARAAVDGNRAAAVAAAGAAAAEAAAEGPEQREIEPSVRGVLGGVVSLPLLSHSELSGTALRTLAAFAQWLAPPSRAELACSCADYCSHAPTPPRTPWSSLSLTHPHTPSHTLTHPHSPSLTLTPLTTLTSLTSPYQVRQLLLVLSTPPRRRRRRRRRLRVRGAVLAARRRRLARRPRHHPRPAAGSAGCAPVRLASA